MASPLLDATSASAVDGNSTMEFVAGIGSGAGGEVPGSAGMDTVSTVFSRAGDASGVSDAIGASIESKMVNWTCYARYTCKHTCLVIMLIFSHFFNSLVVEYRRRRRHYPPINGLLLWCCRGGIETLLSVGPGAIVRVRPGRYRDIRKLAHGV
jgi:hypothetical protein